jgi:hypothetical protein
MSALRIEQRNGIAPHPEAQRSAGRSNDEDIRLEGLPEPSRNGHYEHLHQLPPCREGQRLVRVQDWVQKTGVRIAMPPDHPW